MDNIKQLLDNEVTNRNNSNEISEAKPDPLLIAKQNNSEYIALICALFAYGNVHQIIKFLHSLDFKMIENSEENIKVFFNKYYYRFQKADDIIALFIALKRLKEKTTLENIFLEGYQKKQCVLEGIDKIIQSVREVYEYNSEGYKFLVGTPFKRDKLGDIKHIGNSPYKRYNMFLRWMVRSDNLDMGLWKQVDKKHLILPLDTHTFNVSLKLGLLQRKTYDLKSAILITNKLQEFDPEDPIRYDFALYRIGQEKII